MKDIYRCVVDYRISKGIAPMPNNNDNGDNKNKVKKKLIPNTKLKTLSEVLSGGTLSRALLMARMGQQYGGDRDLYEALGWDLNVTYDMYAAKYERQDIAKAIIDRPVKATWRGGFKIVESDDDKETALEREWEKLNKKLKLLPIFIRLDKLVGIGEYGVLLLGLDDVKTSEDFSRPVNAGKRSLLYVKPLGQGAAVINTYDSNTSSERYGLPTLYDVTITNPNQNTTSQVKVHYTRILHVTDDLLENECKGAPRLQAVYNRLCDLEKIVGGSGEMFWRGARPGYQGKLDEDYTMTTEARNALQAQIDEYEHNLRRLLVNEGISLESLAMQVVDPSAHIDVQIQMISAQTGIPKRILTGSERGELASTEDESSWLKLIHSRREDYASPCIIRPFIDRMIEYKVLPAAGNDYNVDWEDLWAMSEQEQATVGKTRAEALNAYGMNPINQDLMPPDAFNRFFLGLSDEEVELINEMKGAMIREEEKNPPELEEVKSKPELISEEQEEE